MTASKRNMTSAEIKEEVLAKLNDFSETGRPLAQRIHQIIMETNPTLHPRLWYGMPGYAKTKDSAVLLFFREDEAYMTFGFTENVTVKQEDDEASSLVPCAWFFTDINENAAKQIAQTVRAVTRS